MCSSISLRFCQPASNVWAQAFSFCTPLLLTAVWFTLILIVSAARLFFFLNMQPLQMYRHMASIFAPTFAHRKSVHCAVGASVLKRIPPQSADRCFSFFLCALAANVQAHGVQFLRSTIAYRKSVHCAFFALVLKPMLRERAAKVFLLLLVTHLLQMYRHMVCNVALHFLTANRFPAHSFF